MNENSHPVMVVGHKNPDTDSICSAMVYAQYKNEIAGTAATAYRAGNLNEQTQFVLQRFGAQSPPLLTDVYPKVKDIMVGRKALLTVHPEDCLDEARSLIIEKRFAFLPVTDLHDRCLGKITALRLADVPTAVTDLANGVVTSFDLDHFAAMTKARRATGGAEPPRRFKGRVLQLPEHIDRLAGDPGEDLVLLLNGSFDWGRAKETLREASGRIRTAIVYGSPAGSSPAGHTDFQGLPLLSVEADLVTTLTALCLSMPVEAFLDPPGPTFAPYDLVRNVQREVNKYNEGGFLIVDEEKRLRGVVTRVNFLTQARFRVALVDHNEFSQAVDGMEHAEVVEVIDHHRIGTRTTDSPITFINKVVGSTCTIVAEMYRNAGRKPNEQAAGLMLSALLSDTVILRSPTTTDLDREIAGWLASLAGLEVSAYGEEMFSAGSSLGTKEPSTIIGQDQKFYEESGRRFSVSQIEVVGFKTFHEVSGGLREALQSFISESRCDFGCLMVTDITEETTLLLCAGDKTVLHAIGYPRAAEDIYEMKSVLSRKKQVVPYLVDLLRNL